MTVNANSDYKLPAFVRAKVKVGPAEVLEIRRLKGVVSAKELGKRYGFGNRGKQIYRIWSGENWGWVK